MFPTVSTNIKEEVDLEPDSLNSSLSANIVLKEESNLELKDEELTDMVLIIHLTLHNHNNTKFYIALHIYGVNFICFT